MDSLKNIYGVVVVVVVSGPDDAQAYIVIGAQTMQKVGERVTVCFLVMFTSIGLRIMDKSVNVIVRFIHGKPLFVTDLTKEKGKKKTK